MDNLIIAKKIEYHHFCKEHIIPTLLNDDIFLYQKLLNKLDDSGILYNIYETANKIPAINLIENINRFQINKLPAIIIIRKDFTGAEINEISYYGIHLYTYNAIYTIAFKALYDREIYPAIIYNLKEIQNE